MYTGGGDTRTIYAGPIPSSSYDAAGLVDDSSTSGYRVPPLGHTSAAGSTGGGSASGTGGAGAGGIEGVGSDPSGVNPASGGGGGLYHPEGGGHDGL